MNWKLGVKLVLTVCHSRWENAQFALYVGQLSKLKVQELCIDEFSLAFEK